MFVHGQSSALNQENDAELGGLRGMISQHLVDDSNKITRKVIESLESEAVE